ncbi:MAG: pyridoxal phosphate-dependent aminotransferase [Nitrospirae bacterium]|nr:pyridoxal phosphate-dependent aminotransferase [Nitrospirota bacterium]
MRGPLADRVKELKPSPTLAITAKARELRAQGHDVVSFGAGEPDFDTPQNVKDAASAALRAGFTKYTAVGGIDDLKAAIRDRFQKDYTLTYKPEQIVVSCGAKHSLMNLFWVLLNSGDEVIIPGPYWVSYPEMVALTGAKPVRVMAEESAGFKVSADAVARAASKHTKMLILNSPCNPTGATYAKSDLEEIARVCSEHDLWVISDEIYDKLIYGGAVHTSFPTLSPDAYERTLLVNGVSKTYAMTGWRIGYAAGRADVMKSVAALQGQMTSNPTSIAQKAAAEALKGEQKAVGEMVRAFDERRRYMHERLVRMESVRCYESKGAFYLFPNFSFYYGKKKNGFAVNNSTELTRYLLEEAKVAVVPGVEFGDDRCVRLSYAISLDEIKKGMDRIEAALAQLK